MKHCFHHVEITAVQVVSVLPLSLFSLVQCDGEKDYKNAGNHIQVRFQAVQGQNPCYMLLPTH